MDDNGNTNEEWPEDDDCIKTLEYELPTTDGANADVKRAREVQACAEAGALVEPPEPERKVLTSATLYCLTTYFEGVRIAKDRNEETKIDSR